MIYFYYGDEDYIIDEKVKALRGADSDFAQANTKNLTNPDFPDLITAIRGGGSLFGKTTVIVEISELFKSSLDDKQIKQIEEALEFSNDNADIIFTAKFSADSGEKIDKRKKLYKLLSKYNSEECLSIPAYKTAELSSWIMKFAKEKDLKISQGVAEYIIFQVGNNLRLLNNELEKVKVYISPNNIVDETVVKEICVNNEDIFAFSDYVMLGQTDKAIFEYNKLLQTTFPLVILAGLQKNVRQWITLKARGKSMSDIELSRLLGIHEYRVKLISQKLRNVELKRLVKLKENLTTAEYRVKAGLSQDVEDEVKYAFIR